jgi:hypothetical protein
MPSAQWGGSQNPQNAEKRHAGDGEASEDHRQQNPPVEMAQHEDIVRVGAAFGTNHFARPKDDLLVAAGTGPTLPRRDGTLRRIPRMPNVAFRARKSAWRESEGKI